MNVIETLNATPEQVWEVISQSLIAEATQALGRDVQADELVKGFRYQKSMGNYRNKPTDVTVTVTVFERPVRYEVTFVSPYGINTIAYALSVPDDDPTKTTVSYEESFVGATKSKDINQSLVGFFFQRGARKRVSAMLRNIERYISENPDRFATGGTGELSASAS